MLNTINCFKYTKINSFDNDQSVKILLKKIKDWYSVSDRKINQPILTKLKVKNI